MRRREIIESPIFQGEDEEIAYTVTTTPWGSSPTNVAVVAKDMTDNNAVVTSTVLSGSASVSGDVITTPKVQNLVAGHKYRIEVKFTTGGNVLECYFELAGEE